MTFDPLAAMLCGFKRKLIGAHVFSYLNRHADSAATRTSHACGECFRFSTSHNVMRAASESNAVGTEI